MDKQQKLKIALPVLIIIMAFVWGPVIKGSGSKRKRRDSTDHVGPPPLGNSTGMDLTVLTGSGTREKAKTSYTEWGRNPFVLEEGPKTMTVEGILWDEKDPKAIINGDIIGIGGSVGRDTVVDIMPESVIIRGERGEETLPLGTGR